MSILNIIDTIYESKYFPTILIIAIIVLVFLFITIIFLGLKDAKKSKESKKEIFQDIKDITFDSPNDKEKIKEDVTFEMPVLTKNLENFKKSLEEEIEREEKINVVKKESKLKEEVKPTKILDKKEIDNTSVVPVINVDSTEGNAIEENITEEQEGEPKLPKREILKELFKNRKSKEVEPPKVNGNQLEDRTIKEEKKEISKKIVPPKKDQSIKPEEIVKKVEQPKVAKNPVTQKKETKYSGDDGF